MKNNKGITIIALVVTIIVLLILSSISISYVVNKNGIIDNVNSNKENAEIKSIESKLQVESTSFNIQNNGKLNLDKYMRKVEKLDEWKVTENDEEDEIEESVKKNVKEVVVNDKYVFEIKLDNEGIKIEYLGKKGKLGPRVIWHTYSNTYDTLTLNVVTRRNKGGTIQYWIKERGSGEYELKSDQLGNTYTFTGLDIDKKYTIQVIAKKDDKQSAPYIIDVDMVKLPELTDENTKFIKTPESWTNGNVTVTAQTKMTGYTIQTSQDKENWKNIAYQIVEKNGKVYARLSDGYNSGKVYETDITNIDKLAPNTFTPTATSTTKSITVTASTTDAAAANGSGSSGIAGYRFSLDNGSTWTAYQNKGEYTWDNLPQTTNYTIKVEAKDNAGNVRQGSVSKGTGTVETATGGTYNPTTWTNGNVTITLPTKSGFTTRYTIDGTKPTKDSTQYTGEFTVSSNCTITYLYTDGTNIGGTGSLSVTNIDKLAPNTFTPTATSTTKSITVTASTTDAAAANGSGSSGIAGYRFSLDNGSTWTAYQNKGEYTWDNLPQTTNYTIKVEAKDNAGNVRQGSVSKGTGTVETATGGTYNPTTWTNGNVTITLPTKSGFTTRYTIDGTKPTKDSTQYTGEFTVSSNCTITYLYTDGTNIGGTGSLSVTNIDKLAPNTFTPTATSTTKSITVIAKNVTDAAAANGSGSSGIAGYRFSKDNGNTWTAYQTSGTYTWDNLPQTTNYTIKVEAKDNAGNVRQGSVSKGTGTVETATGGTYNPTTWTNGNVTITLPTKNGFTTRYTTDGTKPTKDSTQYTGQFTVSSNCTITYVYTDGVNIGGTGTLSVTNIDKTQPVVTETTATTNKITIKAKDDESAIVGYAITTSNTEPSNFTSVTNTKSLDTSLTGYKQSTTYYVWVKDAAGNVSESKSTTTGTVTALVKDTNIKFMPNTTQWVNASDGVEITASTTVTGFILQTSIDGINWNSSTSRKINKRGETIYARLWDGYNSGVSASYTPTNIDDSHPICEISITTNQNTYKGESVSARLDLSDQYSGIATVKCVLSTSSSQIGTTESLYTTKVELPPNVTNLNSYIAGITLKQSDTSHVGNEYIHVLVIDNAGNKTEIISSPIYFGNTYLLSNKVSVGDYVSYDATNNYYYTSPIGTGTSHGNGYSSQKFKSSSDMKWRVLRVDNGEVVLISETPTKENLKFKGAIFYLYAEQEINSICALYGHGIGANKNKNFSYRIGNESYDTDVNNYEDLTIENSGARSLNYNDLQNAYGASAVNLAVSNGSNNSVMTDMYFPAKHYYPSFSTSYGVKRLSTSTYIVSTKKNFNLYDAYMYGSSKKEIENELIGSTKKDGRVYLLSTRCTSIADTKDFVRYYINKIIPSDNYNSSSSTAKMEGHWLLDCYSNKCVSHDNEAINDSQGLPLRPIVYLKSTVETAYSTTNGSWIILDR